MSDLPVNYLDDILAESMGGKRKFKITHANGSTEEVTIEDISEYAQIGSRFGAGDINKTNQAVNEKFDSGDVVDPMLTTEPGFAADAYQTKLQFDEQNKNIKSNTSKISTLEKKERSITLLYNNSDVNNTITLNSAFTNYDEIEILVHRGTNMTNHFMSYRFSKEVLNELIGSILFFAVGGTSQYCQYKVTNTTTLTLDGNQNGTCIAKVYGIKY